MGREVRRVPKNWKHPRENGKYTPLLDYGKSYSQVVKEYNNEKEEYDLAGSEMTFESWHDKLPSPSEYMPEFPENEKLYYQMYETCSEGTPISPVMETPEELAKWLSENNASAFGSMMANYEEWLCTIKRGGAPSMYIYTNHIESGVSLSAREVAKIVMSELKRLKMYHDGEEVKDV